MATIPASSFFNERLYVFEKSGRWIAYDIKCDAIWVLENIEAKILQLYQQNESVPSISGKCLVSEKFCTDVITEAYKRILKTPLVKTKWPSPVKDLVLLVSEKCNMRCSYCYSYYRQNVSTKSMDERTMKRAINISSKLGVRKVVFFGGEPLLAFDVIKKAVKYGKEKGMRFEITTNGSLVTDEVADFCKTYNIKVSVSVDGPRKVHNLCRTFKDGRGSYDRVIEGVKKLAERGMLNALEVAHSMKHPADLKEILHSLAPYSKHIICRRVGGPKGTRYEEEIIKGNRLKKYYKDLWKITIDNGLQDKGIYIGGITKIVSQLLSPFKMVNPFICHGITNRIAISVSGDIYLCPEIMRERFCIGNIWDRNILKNFNKNRDKVLSNFSRDKLVPYWFINIGDICVADIEDIESAKWTLRDGMLKSEIFQEIIYKLTEIDRRKLLKVLIKYARDNPPL